jgi:ribonuclease BN (tRNA processing enzyme)
MRDVLGDRLRLTVLGCSTAAPHPATPAAGYLVEWGTTAVLLDLGQGVVRNLQKVLDPHALAGVVIGHMHADHYLDIVGLRYLYPWGTAAPDPLPIHLPPGGRDRLDALSRAVSERDGFFDAAFVAREYDPDEPLMVGPLTIRLVRGHLTPEEALDLARAARAKSTLLVHYGPNRRPELEALCAASGLRARPAVDGAVVTVRPAARPIAGAAEPSSGLAAV